ncbi:Csu type fimbrial protein [Leminorella grimontii]|uniref:Csu type fimbrial protein n=1 Tax=Leminorella grimontii TaxID=82981 RepID=UPI0020893531|nr:spore coat protein U domain-containing protein [Leminorella grimontii]GKX60306.1 hypothetical protein SOASR031_26210 [Leminorella grimontii]
MTKKTALRVSSLAFGLFLWATLFIPVASAACSITSPSTPISLGTVSAFNINNAPLSSSGAGGMGCSGLSVGILSENTLTGKILTSSGQFNLVNEQNANYKIPYGLYADKNYQYPFTLSNTINYGSSGLNLLSLIFVSSGFNVTLYAKTFANSSSPVPAGTYSDTLTIRWTYHMCTALLCLGYEDGNDISTIKVTVVVTKDCKIDSAQNIAFAPSALVDGFTPVTPTVALTCSLNTPYTAYINNGTYYSAPWRRMKKSNAESYLQYNLYAPNDSTVWSNSTPLSGSGTGYSQTLSYSARINPNQPAAPAGSYSDTLMFVVEY